MRKGQKHGWTGKNASPAKRLGYDTSAAFETHTAL